MKLKNKMKSYEPTTSVESACLQPSNASYKRSPFSFFQSQCNSSAGWGV